MASDGCERHAEFYGDVFRLHVFLVAKNNDGALLRRQSEEQALDAVHEWRRRGRRGRWLRVIVPFVLQCAAASCTSAQCVGSAMAGNAPQPCCYMLFRFEARQRAMQFEKDVLRHFFGGSALAQDAQGDGVDAALVAMQRVNKSEWLGCRAQRASSARIY